MQMNLPSTSTQTSLLSQIQKKRERLHALRVANQKLTIELESVEEELQKAKDEVAANVKIAKDNLLTVKTAVVCTREKLEKKQDYAAVLNRFMDKLGLSFGFYSGDSELALLPAGTNSSLFFSGLWDNGDDCVLFFSALSLPFFTVVSAKPKHQGFDALFAEVNQSQDFLYLILKARQYFMQYIEKSDLSKFVTKSTKTTT